MTTMQSPLGMRLPIKPRPVPGSGEGRSAELPAWLRPALVAVAALAGLAALFWVSGVPFTSATSSPDGVSLQGSAGGATLQVTALQPGESVSRTLTISNPASEPSRLTMTETGEPSTFDEGALRLVISRDGQQVYAGQFGAMADFAADQGWLEPGAEATYTFTVSLPESAEIVEPGTQTATAIYAWDTTP